VGASYLLVIADREALAWILTEQRMAFPPARVKVAYQLERGDELLLYTTRGCFRNPTRDRGRLIGAGMVTSLVTRLRSPLSLAGRTFDTSCSISVERLAPLYGGVELAPLASSLHVFGEASSWGMRLRRPLVPLDSHDRDYLFARILQVAGPPDAVLHQYAKLASSTSTRRSEA